MVIAIARMQEVWSSNLVPAKSCGTQYYKRFTINFR